METAENSCGMMGKMQNTEFGLLPLCDPASQRFDSCVACGDVCHNKPC